MISLWCVFVLVMWGPSLGHDSSLLSQLGILGSSLWAKAV